MSGSIKIFTGPMFAGKSTGLLAAADKHFHHNPESLFLFKPKADDRYSKNEIVSHDGTKKEAIVTSTSAEIMGFFHTEANKIQMNTKKFISECVQAVCIDEAMFFDIDEQAKTREINIVNLCMCLRLLGVDVYVALLNLNSDLVPFPLGKTGLHAGDLLCQADEVFVSEAVDKSFRDKSNKPVAANVTMANQDMDSSFRVGGENEYTPVNVINHPKSQGILDKVLNANCE